MRKEEKEKLREQIRMSLAKIVSEGRDILRGMHVLPENRDGSRRILIKGGYVEHLTGNCDFCIFAEYGDEEHQRYRVKVVKL